MNKRKITSLVLFWAFILSILAYTQCAAQRIEATGGLLRVDNQPTQNVGAFGVSFEKERVQGRIKYYRASVGFTEISANYAIYDDTVRLGLGAGMFFGNGMQPGITFLQDLNIGPVRIGFEIIALEDVMIFQAGLKLKML